MMVTRVTTLLIAWVMPTLLVALDFQKAVKDGRFKEIQSGISVLNPYDPEHAAQGYYRAGKAGDVVLSLTVPEDLDKNYKAGLSVHILKANTRPGAVALTLKWNDKVKETVVINGSFDLPTIDYDKRLIHKTWTNKKDDYFWGNRTIEVILTDWSAESVVYLVATSSRVSRKVPHPDNGAGEAAACGDSRVWWDCNSVYGRNGKLCINNVLTCDDLPHCADYRLPNPDEDCIFRFGLQQALELLLYTLVVVFVIVFVSVIVKCCLTRRNICSPRPTEHPNERISEFLSQSILRPASAPPSYDDAMKMVNEALEISDEEEEQEEVATSRADQPDFLPPEYSELPRHDEEIVYEMASAWPGSSSAPGVPTQTRCQSTSNPTRTAVVEVSSFAGTLGHHETRDWVDGAVGGNVGIAVIGRSGDRVAIPSRIRPRPRASVPPPAGPLRHFIRPRRRGRAKQSAAELTPEGDQPRHHIPSASMLETIGTTSEVVLNPSELQHGRRSHSPDLPSSPPPYTELEK